MTDKKNFFHTVLDAMIEARSKQAQRELAAFDKSNSRSFREIF